jgi:hypothetical protein
VQWVLETAQKPPQGIRVDTCSYLCIRLWYIIMVIEKSNAWLLHVTMVLNFFRSQMRPQKASRSLMGLSWHPVVLWEFFWNTQNWWCFDSNFSNTQTRRFFCSEFFKCLLEQRFFYSDFFSNTWNQQKLKDHLKFLIYQCWADIKNWLKIGQSFKLDLSWKPPSIP